MPKVDKSAALLNLIQQAPIGVPPEPESQQPQAPAIERRTGKRSQIFLHDADRRIIRELVAYLAGQGKRVSESLIIKTALRVAKPGPELLAAYDEAANQDQRFRAQ